MTTTANNHKLLTVPEAAEALRLSPDTVRRHIASGHIQALRLGGGEHAPVRIYADEIAGWISRSTVKRSSPVKELQT